MHRPTDDNLNNILKFIIHLFRLHICHCFVIGMDLYKDLPRHYVTVFRVNMYVCLFFVFFFNLFTIQFNLTQFVLANNLIIYVFTTF